MGTVRDWGYREYSDDLTPGKGGESSLLFDSDGNLASHAPFHSVRSEELHDDASDSADGESFAEVLAAAGAVAIVATIAVGIGAAVKAVRRKKVPVPEARLVDSEQAGVTERSVGSAGSDARGEADDHDALTADVEALTDDVQSTMRKYRQRNSPRTGAGAKGPEPAQRDSRNAGPSRREGQRPT